MTKLKKDELIEAMTDNLPMLRVRLGLTQQEMAEMIGVGRLTYLNVENKKHKMSWGMFLSLLLIFSKNQETEIVLKAIGVYTKQLNDYLTVKE